MHSADPGFLQNKTCNKNRLGVSGKVLGSLWCVNVQAVSCTGGMNAVLLTGPAPPWLCCATIQDNMYIYIS